VEPLLIVGIDAAAQPADVALACATLEAEAPPRVTALVASCRRRAPSELVAEWAHGAPRVLLAIDAPLGWPAPLAAGLAQHRAGQPLHGDANALFRRTTDLRIAARLRKVPLDVGADRIARAARAALALLEEVRTRLGRPVELAWRTPGREVAAVEVYPAATLRALQAEQPGYKQRESIEARRAIVRALQARQLLALADPALEEAAVVSDDGVDALVCVVAGADFARGLAVGPGPDDEAVARAEGWIWTRAAGAERA
jgi:hypothetical protein